MKSSLRVEDGNFFTDMRNRNFTGTRDLSEMLKPVFQIVDGYAITCLKELVVGTATIAASNVTQINSYWKARTASGI